MIKREFIKCATCEYPIALRIAVLSNEHPCYSFTCPNCKMNIKVGLDIKKLPPINKLENEKNVLEILNSAVQLKCIENCVKNEQVTSDDYNKNIINLMGEIPTVNEDINDPLAFPIFSALKNLGTPGIISHDDMNVQDNWNILKSAWKLSLNGKEVLSAQKRRNYSFFCKENNDFDLVSEIFDFSLFFLGKDKYSQVEKIFKITPELSKKESYSDFLKFCHKRYIKLEEKIIPLIDTYMKNYETFSPFMVLLKNGREIDIEKFKITSFDFEAVKKFYGDCFEILADLYSVICGAFNLHSNRKYDEFLEMNMEQYLLIDKAKKSNCFKNNELFGFLCEEYDSKIRNSSHHLGFRFDVEKNILILEYGRPLKQIEMKIEEYIKHCILIFEEIIQTNLILVFYNHAFEIKTN